MHDEHTLQYTQPNRHGECHLIIGFDFGTSTSKVVIQAPDLSGHPAKAISLTDLGCENAPYLIPTHLWIDDRGNCSMKKKEGYKQAIDLKIKLLSSKDFRNTFRGSRKNEYPPEAVAACYIAILLRESRHYFLTTMVDVIGKPESFVWSLNLGVPAPCIENNEEHRSFRRVGKTAWLLSLLPKKLITINRAISELENVKIPEYWDEDNPYACDFEIVPEIAAGAVGYALSEHQREDLHVIIDIGAGTVDACIFRLQGNRGGNRYSLYAADVKPLGTLMYHRMMIDGGINASLSFAQKIWNHDVILPPIEQIQHFMIPQKELEIYLDIIKKQFEKQVEILVRRLIWFTKQKKRRNSQVWEEHGKLPVLMIGGGSSSEFFKNAVRQLDPWMQKHIYNSGIYLLPAVIPNLIEGGSPEYLTVAWGLSHRAPDIGEIIPADRIPDIEPLPIIDLDELYVGKEVV